MAKGFTVKAKNPKPKKAANAAPQYDYAKARLKERQLYSVFLVEEFLIHLKSFVSLCFDLVQSGASIQISQDYSSMVNFARCKCLGANVLRGPNQLPWDKTQL